MCLRPCIKKIPGKIPDAAIHKRKVLLCAHHGVEIIFDSVFICWLAFF